MCPLLPGHVLSWDGPRDLTGLVDDSLERLLRRLVWFFCSSFLFRFRQEALRVHRNVALGGFVDNHDRPLNLHIHIDGPGVKRCPMLVLPVLMALYKAALGDAGCARTGKALVSCGYVPTFDGSVESFYSGKIPEVDPRSRVELFRAIPLLDRQAANGMPVELAVESEAGLN